MLYGGTCLQVRAIEDELLPGVTMHSCQIQQRPALADVRHGLERLADNAWQVPALHSICDARQPSESRHRQSKDAWQTAQHLQCQAAKQVHLQPEQRRLMGMRMV